MKIAESRKIGFQGISIFLIFIGLVMFLNDTSHSGNAIESCSFYLSVTTCSMIGGALIVLSLALLLILFFKNK